MSVKLRNIKKVIVDNWDYYNALTSDSLEDKSDEFFDYCLKCGGALFDDASERSLFRRMLAVELAGREG